MLILCLSSPKAFLFTSNEIVVQFTHVNLNAGELTVLSTVQDRKLTEMAETDTLTSGKVCMLMARSSTTFGRKLTERCVPKCSLTGCSTVGVDAIRIVVSAGREMSKTK